LFVIDKGLTCQELEFARKIAKENGAKVKVVKNSLATIALKNAGIDNLGLER